jgi:cardiolipin synthase
MELIVEPDAGIDPILDAIAHATSTIDVLIFRLDCRSVTRGLEAAVARGVRVRVMVARKHQGGTRDLRKLELRLLRAGAIVSRTAGTLRRYHGKMMIVDRRVLHVYGFNYTRLDYKSRSFGVITADRALVVEALKLFDADAARRPYVSGSRDFIVSPENSRERLSAFIRQARRELLIYDPRLSDKAMHELLTQVSRAGISVRIIGKTHHLRSTLPVAKYRGRRLHVRAIIRDGDRAFIGSQSLGRIALDDRREVGVIVTDETVVREMRSTFERDWRRTRLGRTGSMHGGLRA